MKYAIYKNIKKYRLLGFLLYCIMIAPWGASAQTEPTGYIAPGETSNVTHFGICRTITNADPARSPLVLAVKTRGEWENFIKGPPVGVQVDECEEICETEEIGTSCLDGAIYVGTVADIRVYAAPTHEGEFPWSSSPRNFNAIGALSVSDGKSNTDEIIARSGRIERQGAALACRHKGPQWYLPALSELNTLIAYHHRQPAHGESPGLESGYLWSSTETNDDSAYAMQFDKNRFFTAAGKISKHTVWCVRRGSVPR